MSPSINRRTMLRGAGVAMALPMLESMQPAFASMEARPPKRMVMICTALGLYPENLWPEVIGRDYNTTPYLELLAQHRDEFTLFSGLSHEDQTGRQPHDSELTWLTSARKPGTGGFQNSISVDQMVANQYGNQTRFPSVTLGTAHSRSQSFTSGGVMIPAETSPAKLFAKLFLSGRPNEVRQQKRRLDDGRSILDQVADQTRKLKRSSSRSDNRLLAEYLESVRQAERDIGDQQDWMDRPKPQVDEPAPSDILDPRDLIGRTRLLTGLIPLMLQTDSTRVVTLMIQDHFVVPTINGVTGNHHNLSHHGQDTTKIQQLQMIESEIVRCFNDFLGDMKGRTDGGSRLLDETSILFGSNLGNANAHHAKNLPIFLAGGRYKHGQYVNLRKGLHDQPLCNLFVKLMQDAGLEIEEFGQSSGVLSW
ncbi:MAG: DUF1552 domain-containing protein [Planctomycetota bacterium]